MDEMDAIDGMDGMDGEDGTNGTDVCAVATRLKLRASPRQKVVSTRKTGGLNLRFLVDRKNMSLHQ